jgi:methyltransferase of ATP-grasp peptide maturase system
LNASASHPSAVELRRKLAQELIRTGDLRTVPWRQAVESVPREIFLPAFFRPVERASGVLWDPVVPDRISDEERLELVYLDETWVTQLDQQTTPEQAVLPTAGIPTSSSTMPGLVVRMLEELGVDRSSEVLEIGTGTGYSTALLSERLGSAAVTSIEFDPEVAARADSALRTAGYAPHLVVGDGVDGHATGAPYDRIVATCSVRHVPAAWIEQTRRGGSILTTLTGWLDASAGLVRLAVDGNGQAEGRFLGTTDSFMPARSHDRPPLPEDLLDWLSEYSAEERPTLTGPEVLDQTIDWTAAFVAQLAVPGCQPLGISEDDGPMINYLIDVEQRSFAALMPQTDQSWRVRAGGPVDLWARVESAVGAWRAAGAPPIESFTLQVTPTEQLVRLPGTDRSLLGSLPLGS